VKLTLLMLILREHFFNSRVIFYYCNFTRHLFYYQSRRGNITLMKLIVGLGNPGKRYENTRHNVGFMVVEAFATKILNLQLTNSNKFSNSNFQFKKKFESDLLINDKFILAKPQTYMNLSGNTVSKIVNHYKIKHTDLWVIHDDLDLRLGEYKIQFAKGPKLHYGISSIEEKLGSNNFWRVRIGVDNREKDNRIAGEDYVLQPFSSQELDIINKTSAKIIEELINLVSILKKV
jgi:peptidyl-tRNA hydrolase, PTH1 family